MGLPKMKVKEPFYPDEKCQPRQVNDILRTSSEYLIEPNEGNILLPGAEVLFPWEPADSR